MKQIRARVEDHVLPVDDGLAFERLAMAMLRTTRDARKLGAY
jgi:hypothetical protein